MLTKTQFLKRINFLIEYDEATEIYNTALKEFAGDSNFTGYFNEKIHHHLLSTLSEDMELDPEDKMNPLYWWLYDSPEAGKHPEHASVWDCDEEDINTTPPSIIKTPEDLYDYISACHSKSPSKEPIRLALKAQDNGLKFALKTIEQVKGTNEKAHNKEWLERAILMEYLIEKITNNYLLATGVRHNLNLDGDYYIISSLEES